MKPTIIGNCTLYLSDCMDIMKQYPDNYFDLACTDPPYFDDTQKVIVGAGMSDTGVIRKKFDTTTWRKPSKEYFDELYRISKNQIIWGINYYEQYANCVGRIVWDKVNDSSSFSKAEIASCSFGKSVQMFRFMWNGMLQGNMKNKAERIHPTQKPGDLYQWILQNYAKPGQKIFDSHLGSGSHAVAANIFDCEFVGCEIDEQYFYPAVERIGAANRQLPLIAPMPKFEQIQESFL